MDDNFVLERHSSALTNDDPTRMNWTQDPWCHMRMPNFQITDPGFEVLMSSFNQAEQLFIPSRFSVVI